MKKYLLFLISTVMLFAVACDGDNTGGGGNNSGLSITMQSITPSTTKVNIRLTSTGLDRFGYTIEPRTTGYAAPTAEEILSSGVVSRVAASGNISFAVDKLTPGTDYTFAFVGFAADNTATAVQTTEFSTTSVEGFALISKSLNGFSAYVGIPSTVADGHVVKWVVTDPVRYALAGGDSDAAVEALLNMNESEAKNVVTHSTQIDVTTCNGGEITPGQPMWVLIGEYAQGSHPMWGDGYYAPSFSVASGSNNGYFRKEKLQTTTPSALTPSVSLSAAVRPNGTGTLTISPDAGVNTLYYVVLNDEQYAQVSSALEGKSSYLQWFVSSAAARELYGAKSSKGNTTIDCSKLSLEAGVVYHLMVALWGDAKGSAQGFKELAFTIPPAAPLAATNNVVAHRGGSTEAGVNSTPDNSIASLRYAQRLGCYASEADIYWTKDNKIIVAHADSNIKINGLRPWEHTLVELQSSGKLANGEKMASLEEYITATMISGSCTKLWLDIKNCYVSASEPGHEYVVKATERACEIIREMGAEKWIEFICTGYEPPLAASKAAADAIGVPFAWMANKYATTYANKGVKWANLSVGYIKDGINDTSDAIHTIESFTSRGIELSVYTIDDVTTMDYYLARSDIKAITTNYPSRLLNRMKK